jgi:DNA-binding NtrC family response regulator
LPKDYENSSRKTLILLRVDCGSIQRIGCSEFWTCKRIFTGAIQDKMFFEAANGGTIFLMK